MVVVDKVVVESEMFEEMWVDEVSWVELFILEVYVSDVIFRVVCVYDFDNVGGDVWWEGWIGFLGYY